MEKRQPYPALNLTHPNLYLNLYTSIIFTYFYCFLKAAKITETR